MEIVGIVGMVIGILGILASIITAQYYHRRARREAHVNELSIKRQLVAISESINKIEDPIHLHLMQRTIEALQRKLELNLIQLEEAISYLD